MPGASRMYVAQSVPTLAAIFVPTSGAALLASISFEREMTPLLWKLYSTFPERCCSSVNETLKSKLKSLPCEDAQGKIHPIRRLYACSFATGARDTAQS